MPKVTKIGLIREELNRIASAEDNKDQFAPTMNASWSFTRVMVIGKLKMQSFDYDDLLEKLAKMPDGAGETTFWQTMDPANADEPRGKSIYEDVVVQLFNRSNIQKSLA